MTGWSTSSSQSSSSHLRLSRASLPPPLPSLDRPFTSRRRRCDVRPLLTSRTVRVWTHVGPAGTRRHRGMAMRAGIAQMMGPREAGSMRIQAVSRTWCAQGSAGQRRCRHALVRGSVVTSSARAKTARCGQAPRQRDQASVVGARIPSATPAWSRSNASPILSALSHRRWEHSAARPTQRAASQETPASQPVVRDPSPSSSKSSDPAPAPASNASHSGFETDTALATRTAASPARKPGLLTRLLPASFAPEEGGPSSIWKLVDLARPEKKPLTIAIGLVRAGGEGRDLQLMRTNDGSQLLVSSSVSMLVPLTIGKLIDFFSASSSVGRLHERVASRRP